VKDPIVQIGDPVLRKTAIAVPKKDIGSRKLNALIAKMKKVLASEKYGVAIAAPQVGVPLRLFVVAGRVYNEKDDEKDIGSSQPQSDDNPTQQDRVYINPEITRMSRKKKEMSEGCLSVRGQYGTVMRHEKASIKALDEKGGALHEHASGLLAHIFQHEVDHLSGVLFVDKAVRVDDWEEDKQQNHKE
jgi:peptide deformylase